MSERGAYQLADGTFVRTQGEIPKGQPVNKVMIPVDSVGLVDFINGLIARERGSASVSAPESVEPVAAVETPPPTRAPPARTDDTEPRARAALIERLKELEAEQIEERIYAARPVTLAGYLLAGICRLGELGSDGYKAFQSARHFLGEHPEAEVGRGKRGTKIWASIPGNDQRGLRYLTLAQIEDLMGTEAPNGE